jgi:oxygen-independent coproporphyrinogen-3 oxidase
VVRDGRQLGYRSINFDLVYGLPFQTLEGVEDAVKKVIDLKPDRLAFYSYAHVPWMHPGQRAYSEANLPNAELKLKLFQNGRELLLEAGYKPIGFDHFALKTDSLSTANKAGKLHRNFMGFSDLRTDYLIGLGVSAISDIGNGFAQNTKTVEAYLTALNDGIIPIFKGHLHSDWDNFIRDQILNISCRHQTDWRDASQKEKDYMDNAAENLDGLIADGLVRLGDQSLKITEKGTVFARHICAAFDPDFQNKTKKRQYAQGV